MARPDEASDPEPALDAHERAARAAARVVAPVAPVAPAPIFVTPGAQTRTPQQQEDYAAFTLNRPGTDVVPTGGGPGMKSVVPPSVWPPGSQVNDSTPPGAAAQQAPTLAQDFYSPEFLRGRERMGSGGARFETSAAIREWLAANGQEQSSARPGTIRIGDQVGAPSRFGLDDYMSVELFGPRGEIAGSPVEQAIKDQYANWHKAGGVAQQRAGERSRAGTMYGGNLDPETERRLRGAGLDPTSHVAYGPGPQSPQLDPSKVGTFADLGAGFAAGKVMDALELIEKPWLSFLGRTLVGVGGRTDEFNALVARRLAARGIVDPDYFTAANEAGDVAAELFLRASAEGTPFVGGLAQAANPAWWVAAPAAGAKLGSVLVNAGVDVRVAGFLDSMIQNGGLPYADRALNAVFINGFTRGAARAIGTRNAANGEAIMAAISQHLPDGVAKWSLDDAGTLNVEQLRELLGIAKNVPSPRAVMAQLRGIAKANDDPALRESVLGPGGGLYRVASSGGRDRGSLGMESATSSRGGEGLIVGQGSSARETAELRAYRQQYVERYKSIADEFDAVSTQIDDIEKSEDLRWGSIEPIEQFRQLAIEDDAWTPYFVAYRDAPDQAVRDDIIRQGQEFASSMQQMKGVPFSDKDAQHFPGKNATEILTKKAVLEARLRSLYEQSNDLLADVQHPTPVKRVHSVVQRSARAFDVLTPDGRKIGTERTAKGAAQRAHDLDLTQMNEVLPGTPEAQAPGLKLETQESVPASPASTQTTLDAAAARAKEISPLTNRGIAPETVEAFTRRGLPDELNAETLSQRSLRPETAGQGFKRYQVLGDRVVDLKDNVSVSTHAGDKAKARMEANRLNDLEERVNQPTIGQPTAAQAAEAAAPLPASPAAAARFEVRNGQIVNAKTGEVDTILTARANEKAHASPEARDAQMNRWAKWANKKVEQGVWREHAPAVPPGQKLVPEEAELLPPGQKAVPKGEPTDDVGFPPDEPPDRPRPPREEPELVEDEGPSPVVWRVVDKPDGTFGLGRIDLEQGITISGERFADREGAMITAEARNEANDAVTMTGDAIDYLLNTLEGIPPQKQLMSPGQAKSVNAVLRAERQAAEAETARARAEYLRAAESRGRAASRAAAAETLRAARARARQLEKALYGDAGIIPTHTALPGPSGQPLTRTREQLDALRNELDSVQATIARQERNAELRGAREHTRGLQAEARRVHGTPPARGTAEDRRIIADRIQTQLAQATNAAPPSPPPPSSPGTPSQGTLSGGWERPGAVTSEAAGELLMSIPGALASSSRMFGTAFDIGTAFRQLRTYAASHPVAWQYGLRGGIESYGRPEVVLDRVKRLWGSQDPDAATVARWSTGELHFFGPGEFTGESISNVGLPGAVRNAPVVGGVTQAVGEGIARSGAAFNNSLNLVNGRVFVEKMAAVERSVAKGHRAPPTTAEIRRYEWVLNKLSGHGYTPKEWPSKPLKEMTMNERKDVTLRILHEVSSLLFSPQWQASRFGMYGELKTTMWNLAKLPTGRRLDIADQEVLRSALAQIGSDTLLLLGGARLTGADIETDPHHTNFARLPLGEARPELVPWITAFSALGVSAQTYNDGTVWLDFTAGYGADFRLMNQLMPVGGDYGFLGGPVGSGRAISASGREIDPWNPQEFSERNVAGVVSDWLLSRGDPRTRMADAILNPRPGQDPGLGERAINAIVNAYTPMLLQDAVESSGATQDASWEGWLEDIQRGGHWFSDGSAQPTPSIRPTGPATPRPGFDFKQFGGAP